MGLQRSNLAAAERLASSESGGAFVFLIAFLPLFLTAAFFLLYSQYLEKNWMQSLHLCRKELLGTQTKTARHLQNLINLNPKSVTLRAQLQEAQIELAAAIASQSPPLIARAQLKINRIHAERFALDRNQKFLLRLANNEMAAGAQRVLFSLRNQNFTNQRSMPSFFKFTIRSMKSDPSVLAVHPDQPDVAPVYELNENFTTDQTVNVSWISEFQSISERTESWITNRHSKKDNCGATLEPSKGQFRAVLKKDKSYWRF